jgi:hypothetical protein
MSSDTPDAPTTKPAIHHWDDPDGSWWALEWDPARGGFHAAKLTLDDNGAQIIVDVVGSDGPPIRSVDQLATDMNRSLPESLISELESEVGEDDVTHDPATPDGLRRTIDHVDQDETFGTSSDKPQERQMGARYRIDRDDGTWWELGWDKPLGTFYATRLAADDEVGDRVVEDLGDGLSQIATIGQLANKIGQPVPAGIAHELAADAAAHPFSSAPRFLSEAEVLVITPDPTDGSAQRAQLARWEASLRSWEKRLVSWSQSLYAQESVEPLWTLPAEPVVNAVRNLQAEVGDDDLATFAAGIGMDRRLIVDLLGGRLSGGLDVDQISQVCEGLHCSPYDLWGTDLARGILHAYGPERWPGHIEPLAEGRAPSSTADVFLQRQLEAHAARQVRLDNDAPAGPAAISRGLASTVSVVCYRREALLAVEPGGVTREIANAGEASPDAEYHFRFRQVTEPRIVRLDEPTGVDEPAPAGFDADPTLTGVAQRLGSLPWLPSVDLVRFVDSDGRQEWLGWNPASEAWEAWDDPRDHYPGEPIDVLDAGGFTDPSPTPAIVVVEMAAVTDSVEFDERTDILESDTPTPYEPSLGLEL